MTVADMLTPMVSAAEMVTTARTGAGLSVRALAARADVAASTVSRVEAGTLDPTIGMLERLLAAADVALVCETRTAAQPQPTLGQLCTAWHRSARGDQLDWTRIRALLDALDEHPELVASAIAHRPSRSGSRVLDVLLAGIADLLADEHGIPRARWSANVGTLPEEFHVPATPLQLERMRQRTPSQLLDRNLVIDEGSLRRPITRLRG